MTNIEQSLKQTVIDAFEKLFQASITEQDITINSTKKDFEGHCTVVTFSLARHSKKNPEQTASDLGEYLVENANFISKYNVVKGFLNLSLTDEYLINILNEVKSDENYGFEPANSKGKIIVEYSSPNTNKPLHLGHLMNNFLGYSVCEILKANGHPVVKTQIINDRGIHICKSMIAWQKFGNGETPESSGLKGDHFVGKYYVRFEQEYQKQVKELIAAGKTEEEAKKETPILLEAQEMLRKWEAKDAEVYALWKQMNEWVYAGFDVTYKTMGVDFDELYYESDTYLSGKDEVLSGLDNDVFEKKEDGSIWADLTPNGLDKKILLRADGTSVYMTQDIGTAMLRYKNHPDVERMIYTVGNEQEYHFKVLFLVLSQLGMDWADKCYHLSYGMVNLPEGKMKSREGTVVDADELIKEMVDNAQKSTEELGKLENMTDDEQQKLYKQIALAAIKYYLLKVEPKKSMLFNPKESIDLQGDTGPFIQYNYVRTRALCNKANVADLTYSSDLELHPLEAELILELYKFKNAVNEAAESYSPAIVASYAFGLAKLFGKFYAEVSILNADDENQKNFRLQLVTQVGNNIKNAMSLLGIDVPEKM